MRSAAALLAGEHDFAAFAAASGKAGDERKSTVRTVYRCDLKRIGFRLLLTVEGNGFLQHMVRNIAGTLLEVGRGRMDPEYMLVLLEKKDRSLGAFTAPAHGLILMKVVY
jgi:tRNA pseudouridine38-40 synthase